MLTSKITRLVGSSGSLVRSKAARPAGSAGAVAHAPSSARAAARVASAALLVLCLRRIGPHTTILPTDNTVPTTPLTRAPRSGRFRALPLVQSARFVCPQPIVRPPACRREDTAPMTALLDAAAVLGTNLKISNLINMMTVARHPILVVADSDMRVPPDYLDQVVAELEQPGVGLATCLYVGRPAATLWSRLGAQFINHGFLPSVLVGALIRPWPGCFGATLALHRETLRQIGGFQRFRDQLADDYRLGAAVVEAGFAGARCRALGEGVLADPGAGTLPRHQLGCA